MIGAASRSISAIGLDLGDRTVKAVQVDRSGELPRIVAAAEFPRVSPGGLPTRAEAQRIRTVLSRQGFLGREVVVVAPDDRLVSAAFELPTQAAAAPLAAVSRVELARAAGCGPQALEVAAWVLPKTARAKDATSALAVGCTHADAEPWLGVLEEAGLDVVGMDARPLALARACGPATAARAGISVAVDLDWAMTTACILFQGVIVYHRETMETGLSAAAGAIRESLGVNGELAERLLLRARPDDEPTAMDAAAEPIVAEHVSLVAEEISLAVAYAGHRYPDQPVAEVLLAGDGASLRGLSDGMRARLEVEVRLLRPAALCGVETGLESAAASPGLGVSLGLSLFGTGGGV